MAKHLTDAQKALLVDLYDDYNEFAQDGDYSHLNMFAQVCDFIKDGTRVKTSYDFLEDEDFQKSTDEYGYSDFVFQDDFNDFIPIASLSESDAEFKTYQLMDNVFKHIIDNDCFSKIQDHSKDSTIYVTQNYFNGELHFSDCEDWKLFYWSLSRCLKEFS